MDLSLLDAKTGALLWLAQMLSLSAVFGMLWLHKRRRIFYLLFAFGFLASGLGAAARYIDSSAFTTFGLLSLSAHVFWISAIFRAQIRKIEAWAIVPLLIFVLALLIPGTGSPHVLAFFAYHVANITGFCLMALAILTNHGHRSATRKFLALFLAAYGLMVGLLNAAGFYAIHAQSSYLSVSAFVENIASLLGLTIVLMSAAKMVIGDTERRLTHLALVDHLTGIYNRRALERVFATEQLDLGDGRAHLSITMFDIDHFKKINDQYGHSFGDHVLQSFVQLVETRLGAHDHVIRMGGEEFAVISKIGTLSEASKLAETIRIDFGNLVMRLEDKSLRATVSAGIAAQPRERANLYELLSMADRGLYAAKKAGRDRCVIHDDMTSVVIPSSQRDPSETIETYTDKQVAVLNRISAIAEGHRSQP